MGLHSLKSLGNLSNPNFSITKNFGYGETFQYLNALFIAGCFLWLGLKFKRAIFYCWSAIFAYILLDDSLEIHEMLGYQLGAFLDRNIAPLAGIGGSAGEIIVFGFFGIILFIPLFLSYFKTANKHLKIASQDLFILFSGILFFGIGMDLLHDFAVTGTLLNGMMGLIEDGGEMVMMSITAWYTWTFIRHDEYLHGKPGTTAINAINDGRWTTKDRHPLSSDGKRNKRPHPAEPQLKTAKKEQEQ